MTRRVAITGLGVISPLGDGADGMFARLMAGDSAVGEFEADGPRGNYTGVAARVELDVDRHLSSRRTDHLDRASLFALAAASQAMADARLELDDSRRLRTGVHLGTGMGAAHSLEEGYVQLLCRDPERIKPLTVVTVMNNAPAAHIALTFGTSGPNLTYSCACSSSAVAI